VNVKAAIKLGKDVGRRLAEMKAEMGRLGLWRTMHAFDVPQKALIEDITDRVRVAPKKRKKA
jgi:hypothetical protein